MCRIPEPTDEAPLAADSLYSGRNSRPGQSVSTTFKSPLPSQSSPEHSVSNVASSSGSSAEYSFSSITYGILLYSTGTVSAATSDMVTSSDIDILASSDILSGRQ